MDDPGQLSSWKGRDPFEVWSVYFERLTMAAQSGLFEIIGIEQHFRLSLVDELAQFAPVQTPIESGQDRAQFATGEKQIEKFDTVMRQHCDAITRTNACPLAQPIGEAVGAVIEIAVGEGAMRHFACVYNRQIVW